MIDKDEWYEDLLAVVENCEDVMGIPFSIFMHHVTLDFAVRAVPEQDFTTPVR